MKVSRLNSIEQYVISRETVSIDEQIGRAYV